MTEFKLTELITGTNPLRADVVEMTSVLSNTSVQVTSQELVAQAYADLKLVADTADQTLTATFAKLTVFDSSTAAFNCTVAADNDSVAVANAGIYMISFSTNFSTATAKTFSFAISVGNAEDVDAQVVTVVPTTGVANVHAASFCILKSLAAGDVLTIEAKVHSATAVTTFNNIDLVVKKIDASA